MLTQGARRGRQQGLAPSLLRQFLERARKPSYNANPHSLGLHVGANPVQEVAGSGAGTRFSGLYERVKCRVAGLPDCARGNGSREFVANARLGGRRTISGSRKTDVAAETAAVPAPPASKLNFVAWYLRKLDERPLLIKSVTAGTIYTCSDLCSQGLAALTAEEGEIVPWDAARSARMLAVGLLMSGPLLHLWFGSIGKVFPNRDLVSTLKKLALGQLIYGPAFCAAFFSVNAYAQGERGSQITQRLQRDLLPALRNGIMYWPACDFVTYRYVPLHLQPFVSNCFSFAWTIYLTFMAGKKAAKSPPSISGSEETR